MTAAIDLDPLRVQSAAPALYRAVELFMANIDMADQFAHDAGECSGEDCPICVAVKAMERAKGLDEPEGGLYLGN